VKPPTALIVSHVLAALNQQLLLSLTSKKLCCCRYFSAEQGMSKEQWEGGLSKVRKRKRKQKAEQ